MAKKKGTDLLSQASSAASPASTLTELDILDALFLPLKVSNEGQQLLRDAYANKDAIEELLSRYAGALAKLQSFCCKTLPSATR